ncbi:MAG: hypothetical protein LBQ41_02525 [Candidatus Ancillula sp.]|jgi:hypothetical protein|nr:hypothetical protein [Candidatus Ancillula sp.]
MDGHPWFTAREKVYILLGCLIVSFLMLKLVEPVLKRLRVRKVYIISSIAVVILVGANCIVEAHSSSIVGGGIQEINSKAYAAVDAEVKLRESTGSTVTQNTAQTIESALSDEEKNSLCYGAVAVLHLDFCDTPYGQVNEQALSLSSMDWYPQESACIDVLEVGHCPFVGDQNSNVVYAVYGDSRARSLYDAFDIAGKMLHVKFEYFVNEACSIEPAKVNPDKWFSRQTCQDNWSTMMSNLQKYKKVILINRFEMYDSMFDNYSRSIKELLEQHRNFYLLETNPSFSVSAAHQISIPRNSVDSLGNHFYPDLMQNGTEIPMSKALCDDENCYAAVADVVTLFDKLHFSRTFSITLGPLLADALEGIE